jgi:hypothetical protein
MLVELGLCRVARLGELQSVGELVGRLEALESGEPPPLKKKPRTEPEPPLAHDAAPEPAVSAVTTATVPHALDLNSARAAWKQLIPLVGGRLGFRLQVVEPTAVEPPGVVVVGLTERDSDLAEVCDSAEGRVQIETALASLLGRPAIVRFERLASALPDGPPAASPRQQRVDGLDADPFVGQVVELFDARRVRVELEEDEPATAGE